MRDQPVAQIAVRRQIACGHALDGGMAGQVDGVGDQRRGGIGLGTGSRQHGDGVGDAQRKGAAAPAAGGNAAQSPSLGADDDAVCQSMTGAGDGQGHRLPHAEMECAVAAIVDIGTVEPAAGKHGGKHFVGYRTGDGGHRRDEFFRQRRDGRLHAPRRRAAKGARPLRGRAAQFGQLFDQFSQDRLEARHRLLVGGAAFGRLAKSLDDQVDRPMVEMQPTAVPRANAPAGRSSPGPVRAMHAATAPAAATGFALPHRRYGAG